MVRPTAALRSLLLLALLALGGALGAGPLAAQQALPEPLRKALREDNPVVAVVNGSEIHWNDVVLSALDLPAEYQAQVQALFPALLGRMIDMQLIADKARDEGVEKREDYQSRLRQAENELLREVFLTDFLTGKVSEAEVQKRVEVLTAGGQHEEVRIAIIVTAGEEEARAALRRLNAGEDFGTVARQVSIDRSAANGGELGFFAQAELQPPEVASEAFSLKPGNYSPVPLKTPAGWTIVKVSERRMAEPLSKAEVAARIRRELTRLALDQLLVELRSKADIDLFP